MEMFTGSQNYKGTQKWLCERREDRKRNRIISRK